MIPRKYVNTTQNTEKKGRKKNSRVKEAGSKTEPQKRKSFHFLQKDLPQMSRTASCLLVLCNILFV